MADIFISYKKDDRALAEAAVRALEGAGYSVWWDDRITPTEHWDRLIEREIDQAKAVLVLWTPRSVESDWVRIEANFAAEHSKLVQVRFGGCKPPLAYSMLQRVDLDDANGFAGRDWDKALGWIALLAGRSEHDAPANNDDFQKVFDESGFGDLFENVFGFAREKSDNGDIHVPGALTIAEAMTGMQYDIDPIPEAAAPEQYRIVIPPGVSNGTKMRLAGKGAARGDGGVGDLYLVIAIRDSGPFRLEGRDLNIDVPLSPSEAAAGGERGVKLPNGRILRARIPPDVADGRIMRLTGCGLPSRGEFAAGDLMLHIKVG